MDIEMTKMVDNLGLSNLKAYSKVGPKEFQNDVV
jgi:hypothetical protein